MTPIAMPLYIVEYLLIRPLQCNAAFKSILALGPLHGREFECVWQDFNTGPTWANRVESSRYAGPESRSANCNEP